LLSYFRINDPYRIFGLLAILILIFLPRFIDPAPVTVPELKALIIGQKMLDGQNPYTDIIDYTAPFTNFTFAFLQLLFGDSLLARQILAFLFIFAQAIFIGIIYIDKRAYPENSFIPSLVFALLFVFSFDTLVLSGELLGSFFILLALNSLFREMETREDSFEMVLRIGVAIGVASLFAFSFILFVPATLIILLLYSRSSGRKFLLLVLGFLLPHLLTFSFYLIYDAGPDIWRYFYSPNLAISPGLLVSVKTLLLLFLFPLIFFVAALFMVTRESRLTKYQSQVLQAMFFWTVFSLIQVIYSKDVRPQTLSVLIPGISYFIAHFFLIIRRRFIAEIAFAILAVGLLGVSYSTRYTLAGNEAYEKLLVNAPATGTAEKVLTLDHNIGFYHGKTMSTPFLNWSLSSKIFEHPEYYENVVTVNRGFQQDPPQFISDPNGLLKPFMDRIPELRRQYVSTADGYRLKASI
jgi:hypothetical protein